MLIIYGAFAHISTMITKKSRDNFFSNGKSIISSSIPPNWCHKMNCNAMTDVVDLLMCMFIMVLYVNVSFLIDMLIYQDRIHTLTTCNCKTDVILIC